MRRHLLLAVAVTVAACSADPIMNEVGTSRATFAAPVGTADAEMERTVEILRERLDALGVEGDVGRDGNEVTVENPDDREEVFTILPRSADLHFHPVIESLPDGTQGENVLSGREELDYRLGPPGSDASDVDSAEARQSPAGDWIIGLVFTEVGLARFNSLARQCFEIEDTCRTGQIAVVVDGHVVSAPAVQTGSYENDEVLVSADFSEQQARELAALLRTGELPVPLVRTDE